MCVWRGEGREGGEWVGEGGKEGGRTERERKPRCAVMEANILLAVLSVPPVDWQWTGPSRVLPVRVYSLLQAKTLLERKTSDVYVNKCVIPSPGSPGSPATKLLHICSYVPKLHL